MTVGVERGIRNAWRTGRTERLERRPPPAVLLKLVRFVAGRLPTWSGLRTFAYTLAALSLITYAVYGWHHLMGYATGGVSLLWLEYAGRRR